MDRFAATMVKIRVKILNHNGTHQREKLWRTIGKTDSYIFRLIETKEAYLIITDDSQMERLLKPENKQIFISEGFELQVPPEFKARRTIIVKGTDPHISALEEFEIKKLIEDRNIGKVDKIIKIPNNRRMIKIIFEDAKTAKDCIEKACYN